MADKILEILDVLGPILYIVVPAIAGIWYNLKVKVSNKEKEVKEKNIKKAQETYDIWEHEESKQVISKIKDLCNFYKDKGHADLVEYLQMENGTVATSKIQNMFMTCLAEDDRFGNIPKLIHKLQRMPYSEITCWMNKIVSQSNLDFILETPDLSKVEYSRTYIEGVSGINSVMVAPVYDPNELVLGIVVFFYHDINYNGNEHLELSYIQKFKSSIESVLLEYHLHRKSKKIELGLEVD